MHPTKTTSGAPFLRAHVFMSDPAGPPGERVNLSFLKSDVLVHTEGLNVLGFRSDRTRRGTRRRRDESDQKGDEQMEVLNFFSSQLRRIRMTGLPRHTLPC